MNPHACRRTASTSNFEILFYRTKADIENNLFVSELREYVLNDVSALHFKTAILDSFEDITEITELNKQITQGRELLLAGDIDGSDYKIIKFNAEQKSQF